MTSLIPGHDRARFQKLAMDVGGTEQALTLLERVRDKKVDQNELPRGFSLRELDDLANEQWVRSFDPGVAALREQMQGGAAPTTTQVAVNNTVARTGHGQKTANEIVRELRLNESFPVDADVQKAVNAKYPLTGRLKDEFPEGAVYGGVSMAGWYAMMGGTAVSANSGKAVSAEWLISYLHTMAAQKTDLARLVLSDGGVREKLARCLLGPLLPNARAQLETIAKLPFTTSDAALSQSGTARTRNAMETLLTAHLPDPSQRASVIDQLMLQKHPVADSLVIGRTNDASFDSDKAELCIGFAHGGMSSGKAVIIDGAGGVRLTTMSSTQVKRASHGVHALPPSQGAAALAAELVENMKAMQAPVGSRTLEAAAAALANQGPFDKVPDGVACFVKDLGEGAMSLFFTLIDDQKKAIGLPVDIYNNTLMSGLDSAPEKSAPAKWDGTARFGSGSS